MTLISVTKDLREVRCPSVHRGMDKENMAHISNRILLNRKEQNCVIYRKVDTNCDYFVKQIKLIKMPNVASFFSCLWN